MKSLLFCVALVCLTFASSAFASPKITEIRLRDEPQIRNLSVRNNEFVFRADGTLYWIEGTRDKPIRHRYFIIPEPFQKLVAAMKARHFFTMKPRYDHANFGKSGRIEVFDGSTVVITAVRDGKTKKVEDYAGFGPPDLWQMEMIVRGVASEHTDLQRSTKEDFDVTPVPARREAKEPTK